MGSQVQHRGKAAQTKPENTTARKSIGQQSPAPRRSCPKQAGKHHREEVIGQQSPAPRRSCPKQAERHHREGVYWATKSSTAEELPKASRKTPPRGSLMGSQVQHRGGAAQNKPENTTAREFNGQPSPAPRRSCQNKSENTTAREVNGQHKSQKRTGYPKFEQKTSREGV